MGKVELGKPYRYDGVRVIVEQLPTGEAKSDRCCVRRPDGSLALVRPARLVPVANGDIHEDIPVEIYDGEDGGIVFRARNIRGRFTTIVLPPSQLPELKARLSSHSQKGAKKRN